MTQEGADFFALKIGSGASTPLDGGMIRLIKARLAEVSARNPHRTPIIAVSALAGATDSLHQAYEAACETDFMGADDLLSQIMKNHRHVWAGLSSSLKADSSLGIQLRKSLANVHQQAAKTIERIGETEGSASLSSLHAKMLSYGEVMALEIFDYAFTACGYGVGCIPATKFIRAASNHPGALSYVDVAINWGASKEMLMCALGSFQTSACQGNPSEHQLVLTQGFIGSDEQGEVVTLPREGSDLTAVFIASVVGSKAHLLKNVNQETGLPKQMSHAELAAHQSRLGTHLVCMQAIEAAIEQNVDIEIIDTRTGETYLSAMRP